MIYIQKPDSVPEIAFICMLQFCFYFLPVLGIKIQIFVTIKDMDNTGSQPIFSTQRKCLPTRSYQCT